jgi:hypothetical protein
MLAAGNGAHGIRHRLDRCSASSTARRAAGSGHLRPRARTCADRRRSGVRPAVRAAPAPPRSCRRRAREGVPLIVIQRQLGEQQLRHHECVSPGHRQRRDHRHPPRAPRARSAITAPLIAATPVPGAQCRSSREAQGRVVAVILADPGTCAYAGLAIDERHSAPAGSSDATVGMLATALASSQRECALPSRTSVESYRPQSAPKGSSSRTRR